MQPGSRTDAASIIHPREREAELSPSRPPAAGAAGATSPGPRRKRRLRRWLVAAVLLAAATWGTMVLLDAVGRRFFATGKGIVETLDRAAGALTAGDFEALGTLYATDYRGDVLGLTAPVLAEERDGVRVYRFSAGSDADRETALDEWRDYLAGFASIDEVDLHLHRLESWMSPAELVASVRFEVIATPNGESRSGIDRGLLRMHLRTTDDGPRITAAELIEGDRVIAAEPHFVDVAAAAGVDFENRYYPAFLPENRDQPLKFGMLRYGPAGITATDYDGDGFYDLFIPDGVEARLFRNRQDGTFEDVTAAAGLAGLDGVGVGIFADFDNDGLKDAFISRTFQPNQLWHNNGDGSFSDVTTQAGIGADCCTTVASAADFDNDGWLDLYVGRYLEPRESIPTTFYARNGLPNQLYRNNGDGSFTNVTEEAGVGEIGLCLGSVFGDYDDDGDADLYVVNDFGRKTLYRNDGQGRPGVAAFTDVTADSGTLAYGAGMSASFGDYDNDGRLDIYVAHIRSEHAWFAEWPTVFRYMANSWRQGVWVTDMALYWEIFRQSGFDFVGVFQEMASGNVLLRNRGDGRFEDVTVETGTHPPGWFWGSGFADFDNDGWQDIYAANGWVYNDPGTEIELDFLDNVVGEQKLYKTGVLFDPEHFGNLSWHGWERNRHLRSRGPGPDGRVRFEEIGRAAGTDLLLNSRGTAVADFWNRGVLDIAVSASTDRHALLQNDVGTRRDWLAVELEGAAGRLVDGSNRDAVGARVMIRTGDSTQMREVVLGDGYGSQSSLRLYFGLGDPAADGTAPVVDELVVKWPRSGREQRFSNVAGNRIVTIEEGRDELLEPARDTPDRETPDPWVGAEGGREKGRG